MTRKVVQRSPKKEKKREGREKYQMESVTYSSLMKLPTEMPPQLMPPIKLPPIILPANDSRRGRLPLSRLAFVMFMEIGFVPTKESCRLRPMAESKGPVVMAGLVSVAGFMATGYMASAGCARVLREKSAAGSSQSSRLMSPSLSATLTARAGSWGLSSSTESNRAVRDRGDRGEDFWPNEPQVGSSGLVAFPRNASALLKVGHWGVAGWGDGDAEDGEWESRLELRGDWEDGESV